jgi:hypothetical protein
MAIGLNTHRDWVALHRAAPAEARDYLQAAILHDFDLRLPDQAFTPGHSTPFGFVADAFFHPDRDVAAWANRSGIKTLGASILAALEFRYNDQLQARVLAGSEDQARFLYEYWRQWCSRTLAGRVEDWPKRSLTRVAGGRFEILAASEKRVRGGKVQRLFEDELDEIEPDLDKAAAGMIASMGGMPGRTVYTSTWHRCDGPMQRLIEGTPDNGVTLHKWNVWESIARCPRDKHKDGEGCIECPLAPACLAKAREYHGDPDWPTGIAAEACGLYQVEDVIKAYRKVGAQTWAAEYECRRPSVEGLVYPDFDSITHRCGAPPEHLRVYRAIDWGHNVFVCLWLGEDEDGRVYLLDTYRAEHGTIHQHADYIGRHKLSRVEATYCDPAGRNRNDQTGRSNVQVFEVKGIPCAYTFSPAAREIRNGIGLVRAALRPATGPPKLYYVPSENNRMFVKAMQSYRNRRVNGVWIDERQDPQEFEHIPDALRYYFVNRRLPRGIGRVRLGAS